MKTIPTTIILLSLLSAAAPGAAKDPPAPNRDAAAAAKLRSALQLMVAPLTTPGQDTRPVERSQGALHASPVAIEEVCNHANPSANRAAICRPVSPD